MGAFRRSRRGQSLTRTLSIAEDAASGGDTRAAIRAIERATADLLGERRRPRRAIAIGVLALSGALVMGGGALAARIQRGSGAVGNVDALHLADRMLRAATRVDDSQALRELVASVQDTIAELTPDAAANRAVGAQLGDLARRQEELLAHRSGIPADLLARAHQLVETVERATSHRTTPSAPKPTAPPDSAPSAPGVAP